MEIITTIIYIALFVIMMIFVFSMGMLRPFMPKKEMALVLVVAFFIGTLGGAFFLTPLYSEVPGIVSSFEKTVSTNQEVLYLDISSSTDLNKLKSDLLKIKGVQSVEETGVTISMWKFSESEAKYFNYAIKNVDPHFKNYTVNRTSGTIYIALNNYSSSQALKVFSDWYKLVFGGPITYAQVHVKIVVSSSSLDDVESALLKKGIVASSIEGPAHDSFNKTNSSMLSNTEFSLACGGFGVVVGLIGLYFDSFAVYYRRFKRSMNAKRKR